MAKPIKKSLKKRSGKKRTTGQIIWIVVSILLAIAMVVTSFAALFMQPY